MKKVLFTATVDSHIIQFHLPFLKLFKDKGYEVKDIPAPSGYKDINEWLVSTKLFMDSVSERKTWGRKNTW